MYVFQKRPIDLLIYRLFQTLRLCHPWLYHKHILHHALDRHLESPYPPPSPPSSTIPSILTSTRHTPSQARTTFHGTSSIILAVQSPRLSAAALDTRVEKFLQTFHEQLRTSTPAFLQAHINAEVSTLMAPWTHSEAEAANRWAEINSQQYVFDRRHKEVQALQRLTLGDLLQMYETKVVSSRGMHHRKLSVQMFGFAHEVPDYADSIESFST